MVTLILFKPLLSIFYKVYPNHIVFIFDGILEVNNIQNFLSQAFFAFKLQVINNNDMVIPGQQSYYCWAINSLNLVAGYLILKTYPARSKFLL
jgi:hypothetical protein